MNNEELEHQRKMLDFVKSGATLDMEKCWVLHRALTLGGDAEAWKGEDNKGFTGLDRELIKEKYHHLLMNL